MTKEQIEQKIATAAEWYADDFNGREYDVAEDAFIDGAHWLLSHQWVSVEDELPKDKQNVFIRLSDGRSTSGWYSHSIEEWFISVGEIGGDDCLYERVTHWMPIPPLAEKGGEK